MIPESAGRLGRRALLAGAGAGATALAGGNLGAAAGLPVTLIVGALPGSNSDQVARAFAPFLERHLPRTRFEVSNIPGEAGLAGFRSLARADPGGGTLGWVATPALPARMVDRGDGELMRRITLIGAVQKEPIAFVSPTASPLATVASLLSRAAEDRDAVPLATPPAGSPPHLAALKLQSVAGTRLNIVAFPSAAAARQAVIGGTVAAASLGMMDAITALRENRVAGLGLAASERTPLAPDLPTLREVGLSLQAAIRRGLAAPAGMAAPQAATFAKAMQAVVADPEFLAQAEASGFVVSWANGTVWADEAADERQQLERLWAVNPWLPAGSG